jgi:hypothetical protein
MQEALINKPEYHNTAIAIEPVVVVVGLLTRAYRPGERFQANPSDLIDLAAQGKVRIPEHNRGRDYHDLIAAAMKRLDPPPAPELQAKTEAKGK